MAFWRRDVWGVVQSAARTWEVSLEDRPRWLRTRDSVTALVRELAEGHPPCARRQAADSGGLSAWTFRGYALAVRSPERPPGGPRWHEVRFEVTRQDTLCRAARTPAP